MSGRHSGGTSGGLRISALPRTLKLIFRLAPRQLGESRDLVAAFLRARGNPDGGFQDRAGASDLYYTVFALDALIALQEEPPVDRTALRSEP